MADIFDLEPSALLCEESNDLCFDDLGNDGGVIDDDVDDLAGAQKVNNQYFSGSRSEPLIHLLAQSDEAFASMVERESKYLPKDDYLSRFRCGELDLGARKEAFDWIWKAHSYYSFGPITFCLAVNYLDRFLSTRELPRDSAWALQLLAVACLSVAAKIEETNVPQSIDLQVGDPKFVFEAKTIQRMELLVLDTLNWKMNAVTPCSFLEHILEKLTDAHHDNSHPSSATTTTITTTKVVNRSMQLILSTIRGIDFLEFKPSELAVAIAISVSAEIQAEDIDRAISYFTHLEKDRVLKCAEMVKDMPLLSRSANDGSSLLGSGQGVAESPIGVLDAACFSYKSDELTTTTMTTAVIEGSSANSCSHIDTISSTTTSSGSPEAKRQKLETSSSRASGFDF